MNAERPIVVSKSSCECSVTWTIKANFTVAFTSEAGAARFGLCDVASNICVEMGKTIAKRKSISRPFSIENSKEA